MNEAKFLKDFVLYCREVNDYHLQLNEDIDIPNFLKLFHQKYEHVLFKEKTGLVYGGIDWKLDPILPEDCIYYDGKIYKLYEGDGYNG